jgi:[glutamine synthetase] adenylyltransferase / [glutamine synthetase]-adenylyl-L-tyrosine phosphorylase
MDTLQQRLKPPFPTDSSGTFLAAVASGSPYLSQLIQHQSEFTQTCLTSSPETNFDQLLKEADEASRLPLHALGAQLRRLKSRAALLIALCDLGNVWTLDEVTQALTRFADAAIKATLHALLKEAHTNGRFHLPDPSQPGMNCGYVVLAMGKHGAFELNYSSDVDLIVLYDAETNCLPPDAEVAKFFVKLTQRLVSLLQDQTAEGYVFRTDLRLRPDPRATQIAISIQSAEQYYLNLGQNWERAAYIKARAIAGDMLLGESFLRTLQPYIWRKYLDFAAIADVQSLIRQIHAVKGHGDIAVEGHNLKLGRGGIREIEFFVQTQQLIAGGRNPLLRGARTAEMLDALAQAQWISAETARAMQAAYTLLRQWEHRAQMQRDEQTHIVPVGDAFKVFATFCGADNPAAFAGTIRDTLETVRAHSLRLFSDSQGLGSELGALVFTGGEDDPETIDTLKRMGFKQASEISAIVRGWHFGRYAATRDKRSREALTELMPKLLSALAQSGDADRSFISFDGFLKGLPAGVQLFAMLRNTPSLLDLIALILGTGPRLSAELSRQPRILEAVLDPSFFGAMSSHDDLVASARAITSSTTTLEEAMDRMRVFGREQRFRVGVRVLSDTLSAEEAGQGFSDVADAVIMTLLATVRRDIERQHGSVDRGRVAVLAMGKLGGCEMTAASDLDLIVVYDHAPDCTASSGARSVSPAQYFTKLTQRLVAAVSAPTAEGELYDVDMRLRPSGSAGPVAVSIGSFNSYHSESAWTWERLALTRARPVAGDASLCAQLEAAKAAALATPRDEEVIRCDVVAMRALMLKEHKPSSVWDIKRARGGLVEVEFVAQFLQLTHAPKDLNVLDTNTLQAVSKMREAKVLQSADADALLVATRLYHRLTQVLRLCLEGPYDPAIALPGLNRAVAQAAGTPDVGGAEALLHQTQEKISHLFNELIGNPEKS